MHIHPKEAISTPRLCTSHPKEALAQAQQGKAKSLDTWLQRREQQCKRNRNLEELCLVLGFFSSSFLSFCHPFSPPASPGKPKPAGRILPVTSSQPLCRPLTSCCPTFPDTFPTLLPQLTRWQAWAGSITRSRYPRQLWAPTPCAGGSRRQSHLPGSPPTPPDMPAQQRKVLGATLL